jgi:hypothetical protein
MLRTQDSLRAEEDAPKLDYQTPPRTEPTPVFVWPDNWRRRLVAVAVAAPIVFGLTFEAAHRAQGWKLSIRSGRLQASIVVNALQQAVDSHVKSARRIPARLTDVPEINDDLARRPGYLIDSWNHPYQLVKRNRAPTVISYGRDGLPGGEGLDADITANASPDLNGVTIRQFIQLAPMTPVLVKCLVAAMFTAACAFFAFDINTEVRPRRVLPSLLAALFITAMTVLVLTMIAMVIARS